VTVMMFATPIMWPVSTLGGITWIADVNPVYHLIEVIRAPMLGENPAALSWIVSIGMFVVGSICAMLLFRRVSRRIVYWL
jgi:ABC-type polysaccharide/polyol phosphate export permease